MRSHFLFAVAVLCFFPSLAFSQFTQVIEWQNTIGGSESDILNVICQTADGGYILGGISESDSSGDKSENNIGMRDYWIVKIDSSGVIQWQNTIGGSDEDLLRSIQQTTDGGYILGGFSQSPISGDKTEYSLGGYDYWLIKTDASGYIQWQNTIGGGNDDQLHSIQQTTDGGYILGGFSNSNFSGDKTENCIGAYDIWIIKTDASGSIQWQNTIGGSYSDAVYSIQQTTDGGYILGGCSSSNISGDKTENSNGSFDYWLIKINESGVIQWQNTIGGNSSDDLRSIYQTADEGYILGGYSLSGISGDKTENNVGNYDCWIVKTDSTGNIQWQNTIGGSDNDFLNEIQQTSDGGYIFGGWSNSNISGDKTENSMGGSDFWVVKTSAFGTIEWQNTIGGTDEDRISTIYQTNGGGYILGGFSWSNISGDKAENCNGLEDYWIVKLFEQPTFISEITAPANLEIYPNPANSTLTIETGILSAPDCRLIISDVTGRILFSEFISGTSTKHNINISSFSQGIYFVQLRTGENISRGRFVKE